MASKSFPPTAGFLAATTLLLLLLLLLLVGEAHGRPLRRGAKKSGGDVCRRADYPAVCRAVTAGQRGAYAATKAAVRALAAETAEARRKAAAAAAAADRRRRRRGGGGDVAGVCVESYEDAVRSAKSALSDMARRDKGGFNSQLSAALTDFVTCEDAFDEMGLSSPFSTTNSHLRQIASTGLYLATLWH